jgi:hypothetical protein
MARVTHVKAAQQRFKTVPVMENGMQKKTAVMRNGVQRTTKRGLLVWRKQTIEDKTQPLPPEVCDYCKKPIEVGTPYKHVTPKTSAYGGRKRSRHESCPSWKSWELSDSLGAQVERIQHEATDGSDSWESEEDVTSALTSAAEQIRELAEAKKEAATNIEDGFGHATAASEELAEQGDSLESWADDVENATITDLPEPEETDCEECGGTGKVETEVEGSDTLIEEECSECGGTGQVTPDEPTDEQMQEWRETVIQEVEDALAESPV